MSTKTLSAELEKLIGLLCLNDFPCGNGSWRKSHGSTGSAGTVETDALLDLLSCSHSPWKTEASWSPQAPPLRRLAVVSPKRLCDDFIYSYFITLHIVDKGISVIDGGLLKFSKLEELVLSGNKISEITGKHLPSTLKLLELRANQLSALDSLTSPAPPQLHYLSLGSNSLGSQEDMMHLTGRHWPQLVCLDLSDCEFQDQPALLSTLSTLPCLRTLVLEGNPFTLAACYPGFTVDSLPRLSYLDASWISPKERRCFRGVAKVDGLKVDWASATVSVGRMRGIPNPSTSVDENSYSYFITYEFPTHQTPANPSQSDAAATAHVTEDPLLRGAHTQSNTKCEDTAKLDGQEPIFTEDSRHDAACVCVGITQKRNSQNSSWGLNPETVSGHSTPKLSWSGCMDFRHTQTHVVRDLKGLKRFLKQGLYLRIEEEKSPVKSASTKHKSKDKKKTFVPELVQDTPIRRILGSVHVPLQSLIRRGQTIEVLCEVGATTATHEEDVGEKVQEDNESKGKASRKNTAEGSRKPAKKCKVDVVADQSVQLEPVTVEFRVELEKWQSASEAHGKQPDLL